MRCRARVRARRLHPHDGTGVNRRPNGCRRPDLGKPDTGRDDDVADSVTNPHPLADAGSDPHAVSDAVTDAVTDALAHAVAHAVADTQPLGRPHAVDGQGGGGGAADPAEVRDPDRSR